MLYFCGCNSAHDYNFFCTTTKEEFEMLQLDLQQSGKSIKSYLLRGICYSTYNYWKKKADTEAEPKREFAPISFTGRQSDLGFTGVDPSGATLLFPRAACPLRQRHRKRAHGIVEQKLR